MINSKTQFSIDQSQINEEYIHTLQEIHQIIDQKINDIAQIIVKSNFFKNITKNNYDYDLVRLSLYLILITFTWIFSYIQLFWIIYSVFYPMKYYQKSQGQQEQNILILYYTIVGIITVIDPLLNIIIEKMIPIYGIVRYLFIYWLINHDFYGCKIIHHFIFKVLIEIQPLEFKHQMLEIVDKISARNF